MNIEEPYIKKETNRYNNFELLINPAFLLISKPNNPHDTTWIELDNYKIV